MSGEPEVIDNVDQQRFEIYIDGNLAGYAEYRTAKGLRIFSDTHVTPAYSGQGLGSTLVSAALAATRAQGDRVMPLCGFVRAHIRRHPHELELVRDVDRSAFDLD